MQRPKAPRCAARCIDMGDFFAFPCDRMPRFHALSACVRDRPSGMLGGWLAGWGVFFVRATGRRIFPRVEYLRVAWSLRGVTSRAWIRAAVWVGWLVGCVVGTNECEWPHFRPWLLAWLVRVLGFPPKSGSVRARARGGAAAKSSRLFGGGRRAGGKVEEQMRIRPG